VSELGLGRVGSPAAPALELEVLGAEPALHVAAPALHFRLRAREAAGRDVYMVALGTQVHIDPGLRSHDPATRERLADLFGAPGRWSSTTSAIVWARVESLLPSFAAEVGFTLIVPCTYDLEVVSARYLDALPDGEVPLSFHFSGRIFYRGDDGRVQIVLTPWSTASHRMPVATWRAMIDHHFPGAGFVRLQRDTLGALAAHRAARGLPTFDATVSDLLARADP
jgi:hypothetical protein